MSTPSEPLGLSRDPPSDPTSASPSLRVLPWLVLLIGLLVAAVVAWWQGEVNARIEQERFQTLAQGVVKRVEGRMEAYAYGLRGARGAVIAAGGKAVNHERFHQYSLSRDIAREFPGSRGFGFVRRVPAEREAAFLAEARREGGPGFKIRQLQAHDGDRYVIQYIEPVELNVEAVGLDIASEPRRRAAADIAMRTGRPSLTAPITLVQATGQPLRSFLLLLPIYAEEQLPSTVTRREASTIGWAYTPLVTDEVLQDIAADGLFALALHDISDGRTDPFFTSPGWQAGDAAARLVRRIPLPMYAREWMVEVKALPPFIAELNLRSPWGLAAGIAAASALMAVLLHVVLVGVQRERVVRVQQARMAAMVESAHDAIIGLSPEGRVTDWNGAAERMFGYSAAEALGRLLSDLTLPPGQEAEEAWLLECAARGEAVPRFDTVRRRSDGSLLDVSVAVSPIRLGGRHVVGAAKTVSDISHRKAAQAEILQLNATLEQQVLRRTAQLRALAARERAILVSAGSAFIATDMAGRVTLFNPAAEAMLHYRAEDVLGKKDLLQFLDPEQLRERATALAEQLGRAVEPAEALFGAGAAGGVEHEWTFVRADGSRLPVLLTASSLRDEGGGTLGHIVIAVDLSDRKRLERELVELNQALTERSVQAEAATRAKSAFLANMSHEIRTPMNAIIGLTHLMQRDIRDTVMRQRLDLVVEASHHLLAIINNVLDLSKIEVGKLELEQAEFELEDVVMRSFTMVQGAAREKGLELVLDVDETPSRMSGDATRLGQALLNLLGNAVKFTSKGVVMLRCLCLERSDSAALLRFEVHDSGIGIAPEAIDKIFRAFEQGDNSTTRRYGGTGLGLTITRELVQLMGGRDGRVEPRGRRQHLLVHGPLRRPAAPGRHAGTAPRRSTRPGGRRAAAGAPRAQRLAASAGAGAPDGRLGAGSARDGARHGGRRPAVRGAAGGRRTGRGRRRCDAPGVDQRRRRRAARRPLADPAQPRGIARPRAGTRAGACDREAGVPGRTAPAPAGAAASAARRRRRAVRARASSRRAAAGLRRGPCAAGRRPPGEPAGGDRAVARAGPGDRPRRDRRRGGAACRSPAL
ncbi:CHASE domain-containing protein [Aquabacterium sp. A7-Y]|uniref:sensor histidine kinase n=1 Tax=Aquabacterium sp. A7-Y TaxID=1349605 RepID=UPI00223E0F0F|nr:CHASE domain-containing protein [Aquabacterium sp. A7-Y]MCW7539784.1 CHASE domain-containing protein [Aquabacterium sp. A7-Y]